ncbi:GDSL esterase/lipase [Iris pallida]|uniref:GDSL esterase/lipase n=1 Tax=Iris pallida TaxID=29817 RepID=A0AAX6FWN0_IRIPA|nr:GDSL esterase/lipase [Iris pallida]
MSFQKLLLPLRHHKQLCCYFAPAAAHAPLVVQASSSILGLCSDRSSPSRITVVAADIVTAVHIQMRCPFLHLCRPQPLLPSAVHHRRSRHRTIRQCRPHPSPDISSLLADVLKTHSKRNRRGVEQMALHKHPLFGQCLAHLESEPGPQGVPADADVGAAEPVDRRPERLQRPIEPDGALQALPSQETEVVLQVPPYCRAVKQRAPQGQDGPRRAARPHDDEVGQGRGPVPL